MKLVVVGNSSNVKDAGGSNVVVIARLLDDDTPSSPRGGGNDERLPSDLMMIQVVKSKPSSSSTQDDDESTYLSIVLENKCSGDEDWTAQVDYPLQQDKQLLLLSLAPPASSLLRTTSPWCRITEWGTTTITQEGGGGVIWIGLSDEDYEREEERARKLGFFKSHKAAPPGGGGRPGGRPGRPGWPGGGVPRLGGGVNNPRHQRVRDILNRAQGRDVGDTNAAANAALNTYFGAGTPGGNPPPPAAGDQRPGGPGPPGGNQNPVRQAEREKKEKKTDTGGGTGGTRRRRRAAAAAAEQNIGDEVEERFKNVMYTELPNGWKLFIDNAADHYSATTTTAQP